jgi:hypothetical protein
MSRFTQYIGLTHKAKEFVKNLQRVLDSMNCTTGMFGETVDLDEWWDEQHKVYVREAVQVELWSSGPMIFTALVYAWDKAKIVKLEGETYDYFHVGREEGVEFIEGTEWVEDSSVSGEVDHEHGTFWV